MLATESGKTANQVSETIVTELINKQIIENIKRQLGVPGRRLLRTGCYRCGNGGRYPGNWYLPGSFRPFGRPVGMCIDWRR